MVCFNALQNVRSRSYLFFAEARSHGVGYYSFSKDAEQRTRQQESLNKLRQETTQEQKKAQDLRALRDKQLAERVKAARNRRRARLGLPPEEDDGNYLPSHAFKSLRCTRISFVSFMLI